MKSYPFVIQEGSLAHFGHIFNPNPVIDIDYVEVESSIGQEIDLDAEGLALLHEHTYRLEHGKREIQFTWIYQGVEFEVTGEVWMYSEGIRMYLLTATDIYGNEHSVGFDSEYFNTHYMFY